MIIYVCITYIQIIYTYIYTKSRGATAARQVVNEAFWQRPGMTGEGLM